MSIKKGSGLAICNNNAMKNVITLECMVVNILDFILTKYI